MDEKITKEESRVFTERDKGKVENASELISLSRSMLGVLEELLSKIGQADEDDYEELQLLSLARGAARICRDIRDHMFDAHADLMGIGKRAPDAPYEQEAALQA